MDGSQCLQGTPKDRIFRHVHPKHTPPSGQPGPTDTRRRGKRTLYVFMDESGNFYFTAKGTHYFLIAAYYTYDPHRMSAAIASLRYEMLAEGATEVEFHATNNSQATCDRVYQVINDMQPPVTARVFYLDKHYAHPSKHSGSAMMTLVGSAIAKWFDSAFDGACDRIVLIFDSVLTGSQQSAFKAAIKPVLKARRIPFHLAFRPVKSEPCGEVADYIAWAWLRHLERGDARPQRQLSDARISDFDLFRNGKTRYY